jgi:hypothetical protein
MQPETSTKRVTCGTCRHRQRISGMKGICGREKLFHGVRGLPVVGSDWLVFKFDSCFDAELNTRKHGTR